MNNSREVTVKDMIYFAFLAAILSLMVMIAYHIEAQAKTPEITTDKPTEAVTELTTEESPAAEETTEIELTTIKYEDIPKLTELGTFKLTGYCICQECCGKTPDHPAYGITKSGAKAKPGKTVGVDPNIIPLGTELYINGNYYIAEDTGDFSGKIIDICVASHEEADAFDTRYAKVFLVG